MRFVTLSILFLCVEISVTAQVGNLIWQDDFTAEQLDLSKWNIETGTGVNGDFGTGQLDRAIDRIENISFQDDVPGADNGCLVITTRKEFYIDRDYTSGRINTAGKGAWGPGHRIMARIYPRDVRQMGQGFAFWMMPNEIPDGWDYLMWPQGGEIDIMEYVGSIPYHNLGSVHYAWFWENNQWQSWNHGHQGFYYSYENKEVPNPIEPGYGGYPASKEDANAGCNGFHTYGIDWYNDRIAFHVDENIYHIHFLSDGGAFATDGEDENAIRQIEAKRVGVSEYSNHFTEWYPFEYKMYVIISAGVGGSSSSYGGAIVPEAEFPCSVFIDWVKIYELNANTHVKNQTEQSTFTCFPNPACDKLLVELGKYGHQVLRLIDLGGKVVLTQTINHSTTIDISDLEKGLYLVTLNDGKLTQSKKLIVN